ncbi:hypothetical protein B0H14DRAFT_2630833 [Mycena olivaceomarginata]|nr:hypothetical protein B0H14DRAFT_2630833 [Mycena olivaceomarginata]
MEFHPVMEHVFLTSDRKRNVCLHDTCMAFVQLLQRMQEGAVQTYNTKLSQCGIQHLSNPETSSILFNRQGTQLGVTMLNYFPHDLLTQQRWPVTVCSASNLPDSTPIPPGERTYANACTMEHGSFSRPGPDTDKLYAAGSDDFRAYIWSLLLPASLAAQRGIIPYALKRRQQRDRLLQY